MNGRFGKETDGRPSRGWILVVMAMLAGVVGAEGETLRVFAGAAAKPPLEEIARLYGKKTGVEVELVLGGSGTVLAQMRLAREGDVYLPGSSDYMIRARREGLVRPETERQIAWLVPVLTGPKGNPAGIRTLEDLTRPGVRVLLAQPETVCLGAYAVEIFEHSLSPAQCAALRRNIVNHTDSCERTATAVALKLADATIGWHVFEHWLPDRLETVRLPAVQVRRVGYLAGAVGRYSVRPAGAEDFLRYLTGPEARPVWRKYGYFESPEAAWRWLGAERPVGGEYEVPRSWLAP